MATAESNISWLPLREAIGPISRHLGYAAEHARLRIVRYVRARRIRMRGRNAEGLLVYATGYGEIDWSNESIELCRDDLIETNLLPAPGRSEGPMERAWQPADRVLAYIITGVLVERKDWTPEMIRKEEQAAIRLGEAIGDGLPARGQKSLQEPIELIPRGNFHSGMVAMKAFPVNPSRLPKVVVWADGTVGVSPRHRLPDYMGPPWCLIEVDWAELRRVSPPASASTHRKNKRGRPAYDIWQPMFEHLDDLVKERGRPFETYKEAADYGQEYLKQLAKDRRRKNKGAAEPLHQTIQEKISKQRPDLAID